MLYNKKQYNLTIYYSILTGIFANTKCLTIILDNILSSSGIIMTILYLSIIILVLFGVIFLQNNKLYLHNWKVIVFSLLLLLLYEKTAIFIGSPFTELQYFIVFTIFALILPSLITIDTKVFFKTIMYLSIPGVIYAEKIFELDINNVISMGTSYAFLLPVITVFVYLHRYYKYDNKLNKVIFTLPLAMSIVYLFNMMRYGSRGPMFCIISYFLYIFCIKDKSRNIKISKTRLQLISIVCVICYYSFIPVLIFMEKFLFKTFSLRFVFISKFLSLGETNLTNGRTELYEAAINGIIDKPLFGHGMDLFYIKTGVGYPHNFLIQMLYDFGLIFTLLFLGKVFSKLKNVFTNYDYDYYSIILMLFFASVPGSLFSNDLWNNVILWLFFGTVFSNSFTMKTNSYA